MCYCNTTAAETFNDLQHGTVPEDARVNSCCWRWICKVRGWFFTAIDAEIWREICQKRGYLLARQNPRGY